jgi:nitrous oxidase accessory protein
VTLKGLTIKGSGRDLQGMDSAVFLAKTAERALVEGNRIEGNLFGVYVHGATDAGSR